jgi:hypothetical protein
VLFAGFDVPAGWPGCADGAWAAPIVAWTPKQSTATHDSDDRDNITGTL